LPQRHPLELLSLTVTLRMKLPVCRELVGYICKFYSPSKWTNSGRFSESWYSMCTVWSSPASISSQKLINSEYDSKRFKTMGSGLKVKIGGKFRATVEESSTTIVTYLVAEKLPRRPPAELLSCTSRFRRIVPTKSVKSNTISWLPRA